MYRLAKLEDNVTSIRHALAPAELRSCLAEPPCITNTIWHQHVSNMLAEGRYGVLDLMTLDLDLDVLSPEFDASRTVAGNWRAVTLDRPLVRLPFVKHCRIEASTHTIRSGCVPNQPVGLLRHVFDGHRLQDSSSLFLDESRSKVLTEVLTIHWKDLEARQSVQQRPSWTKGFEEPVKLMEKQGEVLNVERWTLEVHKWPLVKIVKWRFEDTALGAWLTLVAKKWGRRRPRY